MRMAKLVLKEVVIQGERETSDKNTSLGDFILSGIEPKPAGIPRIKVKVFLLMLTVYFWFLQN